MIMKRNVSGSGGTCPISEEPPAIEIHCIYLQEKTGCLRQWKKDLMRNSGITDCCQSQHSDFLTLFNTIRIMKEAPVSIIVMNTNGQSPYEDVDADGRVMEICDSLWIANTCFAYGKMNHVINAMGKLNRCRCEAPQKRSKKTLEEILEYR